MLFTQLNFFFFFITIFGPQLFLPKGLKKYFFLFGSFYFIGYNNLFYLPPVLICILVTFFSGHLIQKTRSLWVVGVAVCLLVLNLYLFKHNLIVKDYTYPSPFALGISFYSLQAVGLVLDVAKGRIEKMPDVFSLSLYLSFFPQLVAGPIETSQGLLKRIENDAYQELNLDRLTEGMYLLVFGLLQKVVIADHLRDSTRVLFEKGFELPGWMNVGLLLMLTMQVYCDFSGYSKIARGLGKLIGLPLSQNFDSPLTSKNLMEFWGKWHQTLSRWLMNYVYLPLLQYRRRLGLSGIVFICFLISGLWHGFEWRFIAWGATQGLFFLLAELLDKKFKHSLVKFFNWALMVCAVSTQWIFIFSADLATALENLMTLLSSFRDWRFEAAVLHTDLLWVLLIISLIVLALDWKERTLLKRNINKWGVMYTFVVTIILLGKFSQEPFLYFRF